MHLAPALSLGCLLGPRERIRAVSFIDAVPIAEDTLSIYVLHACALLRPWCRP